MKYANKTDFINIVSNFNNYDDFIKLWDEVRAAK